VKKQSTKHGLFLALTILAAPLAARADSVITTGMGQLTGLAADVTTGAGTVFAVYAIFVGIKLAKRLMAKV
jgi:hypothetical protein